MRLRIDIRFSLRERAREVAEQTRYADETGTHHYAGEPIGFTRTDDDCE